MRDFLCFFEYANVIYRAQTAFIHLRQLPEPVSREIADRVAALSHGIVYFPLASRFTPFLSSLDLSKYACGGALFAPCLATLAFGLEEIDFFGGSFVFDSHFAALAASPAAASLRVLSLPDALTTDASAHCWARFTALSVLTLGANDRVSIDTFKMVFLLPQIAELHLHETRRVSMLELTTCIAQCKPATLRVLHLVPLKLYDEEQVLISTISALLDGWPEGCENLTGLKFDGFSVVEDPEFFALCLSKMPNLEKVSFAAEYLGTGSLRKLTTLRREYAASVTQQDILELEQKYPNLQELYLSAPSFSAQSLDGLLLEQLCVTEVSQFALPDLPLTLRSLMIAFAVVTNLDSSEVLRVISRFPNLERISIVFPAGTLLSATSLETFLRTMPSLKSCSFEMCLEEKAGSVITLRHPSLASLPSLPDSKFRFRVGSAPALCCLNVDHLAEGGLTAQSAKNLKRVETITLVSHGEWSWSHPFDSFPNLRSMSIWSDSGEIEQLNSLSQIKTLASLDLAQFKLGFASLLSLMDGLPLLYSLSATVGAVRDLNLAHRALSVLSLCFVPQALDAPMTASITGSSLPCLRILQLSDFSVLCVSLADLQNIELLCVRSMLDSDGDSSFSIERCPCFCSFEIQQTSSSNVSLRDLPFLRSLKFYHGRFPPSVTISHVPTELCLVSITAFRSERAEANEFRRRLEDVGFVASIVAQ